MRDAAGEVSAISAISCYFLEAVDEPRFFSSRRYRLQPQKKQVVDDQHKATGVQPEALLI